jgi:class 3 adenylate cyclase
MTQAIDDPHQVQKIVLFFDICSSTSILEDLLRTENSELWKNLLIKLKEYLRAQRKSVGFEIYKFLGDGWVLLFAINTHPDDLFGFMKGLCDTYRELFKSKIRDVLTVKPEAMGITFGIDRGTLVRAVMNGRGEYIGRPLNVAARLQNAIKDKDKSPGGKVLISNNAFASMKSSLRDKFKTDSVHRTLRNIAGGTEYRCTKVWLFRN